MKDKLGYNWPHEVTKKDLKLEPVRGSGPGGQNRNKNYTGMRITHIPTGISARSDEHKSQVQNKLAA